MGYIDGRNAKGEVVKSYGSMHEMKMALQLSDPLLFDLLNTTVDHMGIKYYCDAFLELKKKDKGWKNRLFEKFKGAK